MTLTYFHLKLNHFMNNVVYAGQYEQHFSFQTAVKISCFVQALFFRHENSKLFVCVFAKILDTLTLQSLS